LNQISSRARIAVVIPALSPGAEFPAYVSKLIAAGFNRIVVVNDGSAQEFDSVFDSVEKSPIVTVLRNKRNLGQGASLKTAYRHLVGDPGGLIGVVTADADGQHAIQDVVKVADSLTSESSENLTATIGARDLTSHEIPWKSRVGNSITSAVVKVLFGKYLVDTQTGLRAFPLSLLPKLINVGGDRFEYNMNVLLSLMGSGVEIKSVPIRTIYHDSSNSVSHFRPLIDSSRIYLIIFRQFFKFASSSLVSAAVDLSLFVLFIELLFQGNPEPRSVITSVVLARIGSTLVNFAVNRKLVFGNKEQKREEACKTRACKIEKIKQATGP
jgi:dolichol-phosphate mannosyltransferase